MNNICRFQNIQALRDLVDANSSSNDKLDYGPDYRTLTIKILSNTLKEGLTTRVHQICVLPNDIAEWECTESSCNNVGKIFIGVELNPEFCFNIVDKGPEANLPEVCKLFRYN